MTLSILIPTVEPRRGLLSRLLWSITHQDGDYEILIHGGELPMGDKLNAMFVKAAGEYVVCVDDDDMLADSYMAHVLPALDSVDFVGYRILAMVNGAYWKEVSHRGEVNGWGEEARGVGPKCPVRRDLALRVPFGNGYDDDEEWSRLVGKLVRSSKFIDETLYIYDWWQNHMLGTTPDDYPERWGYQRDVGEWPFDSERVRWVGA